MWHGPCTSVFHRDTKLSFTSKFPCLVCRHVHFPKLNNICHFSEHLTNLCRTFCKCCLSQSVLTFFCVIRKFQYVAYYIIVPSFRYIKNNTGHNTDPCGTPLKTDFQFEKTLHLLQHAVFCQSAIVLSSRLCHLLCHGLLI